MNPQQDSFQPLRPLRQRREPTYRDLSTHVAFEIPPLAKRPLDSWRRNLQDVAGREILPRCQRLFQLAAHDRTVVDGHPPTRLRIGTVDAQSKQRPRCVPRLLEIDQLEPHPFEEGLRHSLQLLL